jgi:hypothetical protein
MTKIESSDVSQKKDIKAFTKALQGKVLVAGYGSLLSRSSREQHSALFTPTLPVFINGWQRGWLTRAYHEAQTYVGALPNHTSRLNAQLIPTEINPALQTREQDYRFSKIDFQQLNLPPAFAQNQALIDALQSTPIYICETLDVKEADAEHPVNFSYIATCLAGSHESCDVKGIDDFFKHTSHWHKAHINIDTDKAQYPRAAAIPQQTLNEYAQRLAQYLQ